MKKLQKVNNDLYSLNVESLKYIRNERDYHKKSNSHIILTIIFILPFVSLCTFSFIICFAIALFVSFLGIGSHFPVCSNHWSAVLNQLPPCSSFYFCSCAFLHFWGCKSSVQNLAMITSVINPVGTLTLFLKVCWRCFR